jgi:hypothetical protein
VSEVLRDCCGEAGVESIIGGSGVVAMSGVATFIVSGFKVCIDEVVSVGDGSTGDTMSVFGVYIRGEGEGDGDGGGTSPDPEDAESAVVGFGNASKRTTGDSISISGGDDVEMGIYRGEEDVVRETGEVGLDKKEEAEEIDPVLVSLSTFSSFRIRIPANGASFRTLGIHACGIFSPSSNTGVPLPSTLLTLLRLEEAREV